MIHLDLKWLKNHCQMIHYFGLGFIQLKIDQYHRLHFYTPKLPPIISEEDVHNHRYDFTSTILKGSLTQEIYQITQGDTKYIIDETCQPNKPSMGSKILCDVKLLGRQEFDTGSSYWISHETFHRVSAKSAITYLERTDYKKDVAQVVKGCGSELICPFSKKIEEKELWEIVEKIL